MRHFADELDHGFVKAKRSLDTLKEPNLHSPSCVDFLNCSRRPRLVSPKETQLVLISSPSSNTRHPTHRRPVFGLLWVLIVTFRVWMLIWDLFAYVYSTGGNVLVLVKVKFDLAGSMAGQSH
ncbi:hypothetical protein TorRG33x02_253230 [Trema orientale]|uniref:Uncharacterized protein n=1 Tax=Trema orientale TaxID=63057 RepID=A0A2P5DF41_TREOI|nr:hypothetical protein TorRG33x02_253230 [Trema orientale]